ncbi:hypothetical protein D3C81_1773780 [compost metagenome]
MLHVIEHQHQFARMLGDALDQGDDPVLDRHVLIIATEQNAGIADLLWQHLRQARLQAMAEAARFVVFGSQRQPGHVEIHRQQFPAPGQQSAGLATPGRALDHHATLAPDLLQA